MTILHILGTRQLLIAMMGNSTLETKEIMELRRYDDYDLRNPDPTNGNGQRLQHGRRRWGPPSHLDTTVLFAFMVLMEFISTRIIHRRLILTNGFLSIMSLSIHLIPEFGWSIRGEPVFGPSSVFQGHVELHLKQPLFMDRLRLVFQGQECLMPYEVTPGIIRAKHVSLFGVQLTLWVSKDGHQSLDAGTHKYPFTIQMPAVQYPPSAIDELYKCTFNLIAVAESQRQQQYKTLIMTEREMIYMPFVETMLLKQPLITTQQQSDLKVTTKLHSLDYVPGDSILGSLTAYTTSSSSSSSTSSRKQLEVSLKLYKTTTNLVYKDMPDMTQLVASTFVKLSPVCYAGGGSSTTYSTPLELDLPDNLVPTFTYSPIASVTYRLKLSVKRKGPLSMWAQEVTMDWPLTVGTLGAGVRSSPGLMIYSALSEAENVEQNRPKFMKAVEYEDALPLYEPERLPDYQRLPSITV